MRRRDQRREGRRRGGKERKGKEEGETLPADDDSSGSGGGKTSLRFLPTFIGVSR